MQGTFACFYFPFNEKYYFFCRLGYPWIEIYKWILTLNMLYYTIVQKHYTPKFGSIDVGAIILHI